MTTRRGFLGFLAAAGISASIPMPAPAQAIPTPSKTWVPDASDSYESFTIKRASGWFDIINYTGLGTGAYTLQNTLQQASGTVIIKNISESQNWYVLEMRGETVTLPAELNRTGCRYIAYEFSQESLSDPKLSPMIEKFKQVPGVVVL